MFSNWKAVPNLGNIDFTNYTFISSADGSKVFSYSSEDGNFHYSLFNGTTYTNWTPVPNLAGVVFLGSENNPIRLLCSADGTTLYAQSGPDSADSNIYYAIYNGTTYTSWISVPNQGAIMFEQISANGTFTFRVSLDGTKIVAVNSDAGTNRNLYYSFRNGATYTNWSVVPNNTAIRPTNTNTSRDNTKIIAYSNTFKEVYYSLYTGSTYTNFTQIPNPNSVVLDSDSLTNNSDGTKVFAIESFNAIYYSLYSNGSYSSWVAVPNPNMITFKLIYNVKNSNDGTKLYNQDTDGNYYYSVYNGTSYSSWTLIPNTSGLNLLNSILEFRTVNDGSKVFLRDADNKVYYSLYNNGMYSSWLLVPNSANIAFNVYFKGTEDGTHIFAQTSATGLNGYYATFNGTGYTNWTIIPNSSGIVFVEEINVVDSTTIFSQSADTYGNYYLSQFAPTPTPTPTPTPIISDICFPAGTPVKTDQGIIAIDKINTLQHTINGKPILHITQTVSVDKFLICIEKGAMGPNTPSSRTVMTKQHKILYQGNLVPAERLLDFPVGVKKVKYDGQLLYNILLEQYGVVRINNLTCETLHPDNANPFGQNLINFIRSFKTHFLKKVWQKQTAKLEDIRTVFFCYIFS